MTFEFLDKRNWKYLFELNEDDLMFVELTSFDASGHLVHKEQIVFFEDVFCWQPYHTRGKTPLITPEARSFCESKVKSYMKLKAFW